MPSSATLAPPTALVIERDVELRSALRAAMTELGFDVLALPDACSTLADCAPDIVVVEMPGARPRWPECVPTITYTAEPNCQSETAHGSRALLIKPFGLVELEDAVHAVLADRQLPTVAHPALAKQRQHACGE